MQVVYAQEPYPTQVQKTIFLAGPSPRGNGASWRREALELLEKQGFDGHVSRNRTWTEDYISQVEWEDEFLRAADVILFWVPRDMKGDKYGTPMPGLTTNDEWGVWKDSGKVVWGAPEWADKVRYQGHYVKALKIPTSTTLAGTIEAAIKKVGDGAEREGLWAPKIPHFIWKHEAFRKWYDSQTNARNEVRRVDIKYAGWIGQEKPFLIVIRPVVWIRGEDREKTNEVVVLRPDISVVALYQLNMLTPTDSKFALIKEFRTPVRNEDSYVYELPGGSSFKGGDPLQTAADEVSEEMGFAIAPERLKAHGSRQMGATLCGYHAHFFAAELTDEEMARLEADTEVHGENAEERTYIEVKTLGEILQNDLVDWPMLGMIFSAFTSRF